MSSDGTPLWSAKRWGARIRSRGEDQWLDLKHPFALVGSDPRCDVQLGDSKLPSVVYLVVACGDRIEVWPTCPLAFPIWGRVSKSHVLLVGKSRIQFYFKEDPKLAVEDEDSLDVSQDDSFGAGIDLSSDHEPLDQVPLDQARSGRQVILPTTAQLILDWGGGPKAKSLNRNVSIIGEDHPSLIRLHRAALHRCDHGVVCYGDDVWLIELHPERLAENESVIRRVMPGESSVLLGGIHLWVEGADPIDLDSLVRSPVPQIEDARIEGAGIQGASAHDESFADALTWAPGTGGEGSVPGSRASGRSAKKSNRAEGEVAKIGTASDDEVEQLTMKLTDRMLETNTRKAFRRRLLRIAAIAAIAVFAVIVVAAIVFMGVMPIFRSIYQS